MKQESKLILGLRRRIFFTIEERHKIIQEMISTDCTKREIWKKYTGEPQEHGQILRWMVQLDYIDKSSNKITLDENSKMATKKSFIPRIPDDSFENIQLKKKISELEIQLKDAELKAIAFSTMVDIAEKEFNIPIRKKVNTKPLKQ